MRFNSFTRLADRLHEIARPIEGSIDDFQPLVDQILAAGSRFVLIGEASHGTHEFYRYRAQLTKRLIRDHGFGAVVVEADWPDAWRVNRFVRGFMDDDDATDALSAFKRFPQWMWRNADVLDFVGWLRDFNDAKDQSKQTGFYGMDLYSLQGSIRAVLEYLDKVDPAAGKRARYRYGCFEDFGEDPQGYGFSAGFDMERSCEQQVVQELMDLQKSRSDYAKRDGRVAEDEFFFAEQNARLVTNAERYYRAMFSGRHNTWNLRDEHMADTIAALTDYLDRHRGSETRCVVWAHNSHLGDARATDAAEQGEWNVGQLCRQRWGERVFNVGFSTYTGTVTAAHDWDGPAERMRVNPGMVDSYESLFHEVGLPRFLLTLRDADGSHADLVEAMRQPRLQRAIGVIYRPRTERISHYFHARLADQFDAMIHIDHTRAVEPLERSAEWKSPRVEEETYPFGV